MVMIHPADLVHSDITDDDTQPTIDTMSYDRFWAAIQKYTGQSLARSLLIAEGPDDSGDPSMFVGIDSALKWRTVLQRCHDAGAKEITFFVLSEEEVKLTARRRRQRGAIGMCLVVVIFVMSMLLLLRGLRRFDRRVESIDDL